MRIIILLFLIINLHAENLPWEKELLRGELENGFKYTILKNDKPENRVELRLLVKIGSLEENEQEKGIAHFVEHMAFNGTKNFKGNSLIKYLESIGVEFGSHLNASTSMEQTMYQLSLTKNKNYLDKGFLIFKDWAGDISFTKEEVDKERGIILEEARSRANAQFRIQEQAKDTLYEGSKYKDRAPIGDLEIIKNIEPKKIEQFYKKWYRPEFMHFIVVGDINKQEIEKKIIKTFSSLKNSSKEQRAKRIIPKIDKQRYLFTKEKELHANSLSYHFFKDYKKILTKEDYKKQIIENLALTLYNKSNASLLSRKNPIAQSLRLGSVKMSQNLRNYTFTSVFQGHQEKAALEELVKNIYAFEKYGFSQGEFKALIKNRLNSVEEAHKNIKDNYSSAYATKLSYYASEDNIFIDREFNYKFLKNLYNTISLKEVNQAFKELLDTKAQLINYDLNSQATISKRTIKKTIKNAKKDIKRVIKNTKLSKTKLVTNLKEKKIIKESYNKKFDFYEFTLENGLKVIYKYNNYIKNSVNLYAFSKGGYSLLETKDLLNAKYAANIITNSGFDKYSLQEINQIYSGKQISLRPFINRYFEGFQGGANTKDFESLLEQIYLFHKKIKVDKNILENTKQISIYRLKNLKSNPNKLFSKELGEFYYKNNKRYIKESSQDIKEVSDSRILEIYKDRFADANNFIYIFTGDIKKDRFKKLISKYLGNLSSLERKETYRDRKIYPLQGNHTFKRAYQNSDISDITISYVKKAKYSLEEAIKLSALKDVLSVKLREFIREEKSGVYGIGVSTSFSRIPYDEAGVIIKFSCEPKRKEELISYINKTISELQEKEINQSYLNSFIKKRVLGFDEAIKNPNFWQEQLKKYAFYNDDLNEINKYQSYFKNLKPKDIKEKANFYFNEVNIIQTQLNPKE